MVKSNMLNRIVIGVFVLFLIFSVDVLAQTKRKQSKTRKSGEKISVPSSKKVDEKGSSFFKPMTFQYVKTCDGRTCPRYIVAEGVISKTTPENFKKFLTTIEDMPSVYFHSPGGDLLASMRLGRLIRKSGLSTIVGVSEGLEETGLFNNNLDLVRRPECLSACVYAFTGGKARALFESGKLGVHQFYTINGKTDESSVQITMTILSSYFDEMDIDRRVLDIASVTTKNEITVFNTQQAKKLNLDNSEPLVSGWELQAFSDGKLYIKLSRIFPSEGKAFVFFITKVNDDYLITIQYSIKQEFRTEKEVEEIFSDHYDSFPTFATHPGKFETYTNKENSSVLSAWTMSKENVASISIKLKRSAMEKLVAINTFYFDANFAMYALDIDPSTEIPTKNLGKFIVALQNSRKN